MNWKIVFPIAALFAFLPLQSFSQVPTVQYLEEALSSHGAENDGCWSGTGGWLPGTLQLEFNVTGDAQKRDPASGPDLEENDCAYV